MLSQSDQIEAATIITSNTAISSHSEPSNNNNNNNNNVNETQGSKSEPIQQSLLNHQATRERELERRRRQPQQHERPLSQTDSSPPATGDGINESKIDHEKLWVYFRRSKVNTARLKCLLCSAELYKPIGDNLVQNNSMRSLLWNHLRVKHAIDGNINDSNGDRRKRRQVAFSSQERQQQRNEKNNTQHTPSASNSHHHHHLLSHRLKTNATATTPTSDLGKTPSQHSSRNNKNMTKAGQRHPKLMSANSKKPPIENNDIYDLRRDLDLLDYSDLSKASLKPLPNASLSRNIFERLNQLSLPVTRKLKFWNKKSFQVNQYDPCFKVIYLGNLGVQFWSKDETCLDKPLNTLWNNYLVNMKTEIVMRLTICNSGLKAITRQHGLTQYWSNRLVYCCSHKSYPKVFAWIYRHEGKKMRQELRCHAVFCSSPERASKMVSLLNQRLVCALEEFKREKKSRGPTPSIVAKCNLLSSSPGATGVATAAMTQTTLPRTVPLRRQILAKGAANFRPPLERSKSAPKLTSIREEDYESEEDEQEEDGFGDDDDDDDDDDDHLSEEDGSNHGNCELEGDDISRDELEYEHSFDDGDDDSNSDYFHDDDDDEIGKHDDGQISGSTYKAESNEETSNSSVYAAGDISYDNIVANRQHLSTNQERLDNESTLTAPIITKSSSPLKERSSFRSASLNNQNESLHSDRTESMSDGGQQELDSQLASTTSSTLNSCHINNTSTPIASDHETDAITDTTATNRNNHQNHNAVASYFGQIKL